MFVMLTVAFLGANAVSRAGPVWQLRGIQLDDVKETTVEKNISLPDSTRSNGTMVAHVYLVAEGKEADPHSGNRDSLLMHVSTPLTRYIRLLPQNARRNLLVSKGAGLGAGGQEDGRELSIVSHWKPVLHIEVVEDRNEYPFGAVPADLPLSYVQTPDWPYLPMIQINELGIQKKHLVPIEASEGRDGDSGERKEGNMPLKISFRRVHLGLFRIGRTMAESLRTMSMPDSPFRMSEMEVDNLRQLFFETEPRLLAATMFASIMHLLFDFLAFKSDISHWRDKETMEGVSKTSVTLAAVGHVIAVFYLWDKRKETSSLVIGGAIVAATGKNMVDNQEKFCSSKGRRIRRKNF
ncbi:MAG: cleft lip and palate transmembrane 1 [Olpidium bornovanus]|uniref:Cleft lip and palate transmembrane 1 n=1 Tax=Olpidium bornovanus TaxID=278681 RepID=A0A8H8A197_9FUNG|nr:MAG: cleft lip and palate transmembrane 1 [Olpidium bornovanus]